MSSTHYIYQIVHTLAHHPLYVERHCRLLEHIYMEVYFRPITIDSKQIHNDIVALLKEQHATEELSVYVEIRIDVEGEISLHIDEVSIYEGYALRTISPSAEKVLFDVPFGPYHTSIRREVVGFANDIAHNIGGDLAVECNANSVVGSIGGCSTFGIINRRVVASTSFMSVERELTIEAARACKLEVVDSVITINDLMHFDEVLICDHYGLTSISRYAHRHYLSLIAPKIAEELATPWLSPNSI